MPSAPSQLRPQTPWVVHSLFDMQAQIGQWKAAQETLDTGMRRKVVTADKRPHAAGPAAGRAQPRRRDATATPADALALAREAFGLAPERIAVTQRLAELQIKTGDGKRAHEDAGARLGAGAASRSRRALSQGVGRERSAEAGRHRAPAGRRRSPTTSKAIWRWPRRRSTPACGARRGGISRPPAAPTRRSASAA